MSENLMAWLVIIGASLIGTGIFLIWISKMGKRHEQRQEKDVQIFENMEEIRSDLQGNSQVG